MSDDAAGSGSGSGSGTGSRARIAVPAAFAVVAAAVLIAWAWLALPGIIAERTLGLLIGVACDPVDIHVTPDLTRATIGRTECSVPAGPIASFTLSNGADVSLLHLRATTIDVPRLAVRPRALELAGTAVAMLLTGDTPDPLRRLLGAFAHLATRTDLPEQVTVGEIRIGSDEDVIQTRGLVLRHGPGTFDVALPTLAPPPYSSRMIRWTLAVNDIAVHATPDGASLTGHFDVETTILWLEFTRTVAFRLTGTHLDDARAADYTLWIEPSAELTRLRETAATLVDELDDLVRDASERAHEPAQDRDD